ncbi:hypothetical protein [Polaromonas sp. A23]|uniref:hypothetical protein n=1 Tax=Polaromonas sp. A23 TaxID=1944133 RepID=UPI000985E79E|nr:hypothetical protein [Polaromonas sp. A23]OOG44164.1 hypothetical protein B0B52_07255 [Polaromonas sp. A23]
MHYLLFIGAFLFFAFIAPLKVTLATCAMLLIVTAVIRFTTRAVAGVESSYGEAAKAMGLSFFFVVIAFFVLLSFSTGTGVTQFTGLAGYLVFVAFLLSYVLGFKLSLGLSLGVSAIVAVISTVASTALFLAFRSLA